MLNARVLVVDDEPDVCDFLGNVLRKEGASVSLADSGQRGLALLECKSFDVLFTDLRMPDLDGFALLRGALRLCPPPAVVVCTARATLESSIEAMRLGACDYVTKPCTPQAVVAALERALDIIGRRNRSIAPTPAAEQEEQIIDRSAAMREACVFMAKVAPTDFPVLLVGESGVGKGIAARTIHGQSRRASGPFLHLNCRAIPEAQLQQWLFGEDNSTRQGQQGGSGGSLEAAAGGTVFLAGVDCLPLWAQCRLVDVFQRGCFRRSAGSPCMPMDGRLIASTTSNLETAVAEGRFDRRLDYFLNAIVIRIPPLRERRQGIRALAGYCLEQSLSRRGSAVAKSRCRFTEEAWQRLLEYDWPGNFPELANVIARAVATSDTQEIGREAIEAGLRMSQRHRSDSVCVPLAGGFREIERHLLEEVISRCRGNKAAAARLLGLHRRTLYRLLEDGE